MCKLAVMYVLYRGFAIRIKDRCPEIGALLFVAALTFAMPASADGFRCGVHIIDRGMQMFEVLDACGEPEQVTHSAFQRPEVVWIRGRPYSSGALIDIAVEVWVYNFGSSRLMQKLRFENGELVEVNSLDYGYQRPP